MDSGFNYVIIAPSGPCSNTVPRSVQLIRDQQWCGMSGDFKETVYAMGLREMYAVLKTDGKVFEL